MKKITVDLSEVQLAIILNALENSPQDKQTEKLIEIINENLDTFEPTQKLYKV